MSVKFKWDPEVALQKGKSMKISAHCNITNPETTGYPYIESIKSFANLCDEVIVVDGGTIDGSLEKIKEIPNVRIIEGEKWERDFDWKIIGRNTQIGFEACKNDWRFHFDTDYIFHEDYKDELLGECASTSFPAIEIKKVNLVLVNEHYHKSHKPLLVNGGNFKAVCYGIAVDKRGRESATFLSPIVKTRMGNDGLARGEVLTMSTCRLHRSNVPVFTYDFTFMTKEQITELRHRFDNALCRFRKEREISSGDSFSGFISMMKERHGDCKKSGTRDMKLIAHSKFIRDKVESITPEMFGYNSWGLLE